MEELKLVQNNACQIPLMHPSSNDNCYVLSPSTNSSPYLQELMNVVGRVLGMAHRQDIKPVLDIGLNVCKQLTQESITFKEFNEYVGGSSVLNTIIDNPDPIYLEDAAFTVVLSNREVKKLIPNGDVIYVTEDTRLRYISLAEQANIHESSCMFKQLYQGLKQVLPVELMPIFTADEIKTTIFGKASLNLSFLKGLTKYKITGSMWDCSIKEVAENRRKCQIPETVNKGNYDDYKPETLAVCDLFWQAMEMLTEKERFKILFYAAETLIINFSDFTINLDFTLTQKHWLSSRTCFTEITIAPYYESVEMLYSRLKEISDQPDFNKMTQNS